MHIKWNLSSLLEVISLGVAFLCGKMDLDSEADRKWISVGLKIFSGLYLALGCLTLDNYFIMTVLNFMQRYRVGLCIYLVLFAMIPPTAAFFERKNPETRITSSYVKGNLIFNFFGSCSACAMFILSHNIIEDFSYLVEFQIEGIVSILISVCAYLVLAYQSIEQHKKLPDHDASIKWLNQKLNMLHLFHAFFFSAMSVVSVVCYSIYCYIHNKQLMIRPSYYLLLTLALVFFYSLSQHFHKHVYMVFVVMVPVILVSSVYWMSWFSMSKSMRGLQWVFIVGHSLVYAFLIFYRNEMIVIKEYAEIPEDQYKIRYRIKKKALGIEHGFQVILLAIVIICYSISWLVPMLTQRIPANTAEKIIIKICEDADIDTADVIEMAKERSAYDEVNQDYDRGKYLKFVYEELHMQIVDKKIIDDDSTFLTYEDLQTWYMDTL